MNWRTDSGALRARYDALILLVTTILLAAGGYGYTRHVQRESDQRWCALVSTLDQRGYDDPRLQQQIHELRMRLGCGGTR